MLPPTFNCLYFVDSGRDKKCHKYMFTFCLLWNLSFATTYLNRDKFTHNFLLCYHVATGRASQARLQNPRHLAVQ